jgi:L-galactose dehydrogenase/L-glyceraldehyde 3-phosphate reductase
MEQRRLGQTGLAVSVLGYGCGAVGGLMVRGSAPEQDRAVGRAIDHGITYFDTAALYGDGASERNLGRALRALRADVTVGTKVRIAAEQRGAVGEAIAASLEASLRRLGRDSVDLFQLHNPITLARQAPALSPEAVLGEAVPALERLRDQGKARWFGITALGDPAALRRVLDAGAFATAQVPYNPLNPSAVGPLPPGSAAPDQERLILHAAEADVGVIAIRVLAGGALSGTEARHPVAAAKVEPIASGPSYAADVAQARRLRPLVEAGHAADLVEAALRFAITPGAVSTALVGTSSLAELEHAAAAVRKGPLSPQALQLLDALARG